VNWRCSSGYDETTKKPKLWKYHAQKQNSPLLEQEAEG